MFNIPHPHTGKFSCEVMLYLLALKVCYPERVFLIRGNHESRGTTGFFGFKEECLAKLGLPAYYRFLLAFECMPLSAVIETNYGRIFAAHGGTRACGLGACCSCFSLYVLHN
jgi:serine/threonine-protein phosphatase 2B catalytic subunit